MFGNIPKIILKESPNICNAVLREIYRILNN